MRLLTNINWSECKVGFNVLISSVTKFGTDDSVKCASNKERGSNIPTIKGRYYFKYGRMIYLLQ